MKYFVILILIGFSVPAFAEPLDSTVAEMSFSEFQIFCSDKESQNWNLLSPEQRQRLLLCEFDSLSEKYYDWIGIERNWKNFTEQIALEYAQMIPQYSETGSVDSLIINTFVSGRDSFPPPMGARISFYYLDDDKTKRFFEIYEINILGKFEKIRDYRLPTLKLFKIGYGIDEIKCKENLVLIQKYDDSPACVKEQTVPRLMERNWIKEDAKQQCEAFSGIWNKDFATCFDFSDEYDCKDVGGKLVSRAYTGEQPDYSKKSDSFVCEFRK